MAALENPKKSAKKEEEINIPLFGASKAKDLEDARNELIQTEADLGNVRDEINDLQKRRSEAFDRDDLVLADSLNDTLNKKILEEADLKNLKGRVERQISQLS